MIAQIKGEVVGGRALGRTIGFPTANVEVAQLLVGLEFGVYMCRVVVAGQRLWGVVSVGCKPTVDDAPKPTVECHILDFSGDLYGQTIELELLRFVREIRKFDSIDQLKMQIGMDVAFCREVIPML